MRALLLLAFGGPRSLDEVEFLLTRLFGGRKPSPEQLERIKERYRLIGGFSPLTGITQRQARALEVRLNARGFPFRAYVGMRYNQPLIEETLHEIHRDGMKEVVAIPMAPFRSRLSTGAYIDEVSRVRKSLEREILISFVEGWYLDPLFLEAVRERILEGLKKFNPEERKRVHLIFTAHSLPKRVVESDPYAREIEECIRGVIEGMPPFPWHMAYQSKGGGTEEWAGPEVEVVLKKLSEEGVGEVLIVPIGFVSDHIEVLYDIDILYKERAASLGIMLRRTESLNCSERFIEALSTIIEEHITSEQGARS